MPKPTQSKRSAAVGSTGANGAPRAGRPAPRGPARDNPRAELLQKSILEAAARLFAERGYHGTSLVDVAEALGLSRPSLYYYYPSKERLIEAILDEVTFPLERRSSSLADRRDIDAEARLHQMVEAHALWLLEHGIQFRVIDRCQSELPDHLAQRHLEAKRAVLGNFETALEEGMATGQFLPANARVAAFNLIGMCSWTAWWFKPGGELAAAEVARTTADMAVRSVLRPGGSGNGPQSAEALFRSLHDDLTRLERMVRD